MGNSSSKRKKAEQNAYEMRDMRDLDDPNIPGGGRPNRTGRGASGGNHQGRGGGHRDGYRGWSQGSSTRRRRYIIRGDDSNKSRCFGQVSYDKMGVLDSPCSFIYFMDLLQWLVSLFHGRPRRWTVVKQSLHILVTYKVINAPTSDPLLHCCSTQPVHSTCSL
ncbi:uncharacterized protein EI90DRAFT_3065369 [Cantharellus anzutake]|uniref:uncharacterized protein n=1 Tax=Cantharellus anzutake TaxID=1750568 RepID=UPI001908CE81|nr:uncharacterized protein EI90DRAFT_3065369 [Cantharellus anzutake]KAF8328443.1 hypothetical protein EI90DRAFT_3065369 [Cantharellus anzutake]